MEDSRNKLTNFCPVDKEYFPPSQGQTKWEHDMQT